MQDILNHLTFVNIASGNQFTINFAQEDHFDYNHEDKNLFLKIWISSKKRPIMLKVN